MTKLERLKTRALATHCRILPDSFDARFVANMAYTARTAPASVLTPAQKYNLDAMVWKYRRQLAGRPDLGFEMPEQPPREADYERPVRERPQGVLL